MQMKSKSKGGLSISSSIKRLGLSTALVSVLAVPAFSQSYDLVIDTDQTSAVQLSASGGSVLVQEGVTVSPNTSAADFALGGLNALNWTVVNNGTINYDPGSGGYGVQLVGDTSAVINAGSIYGSYVGLQSGTNYLGNLDAISVTNLAGGTISGASQGIFAWDGLKVENHGTISGGSVGIYGTDSGKTGGDTTKSIANYGTISGGNVAISLSNGTEILNAAGGQILGGANGDGIDVSNSNSFNITNEAESIIRGGRRGINSAYFGTYVNLDNAGTIEGGTGAGAYLYASSTVNNREGATISGAGGLTLGRLSYHSLTNAGTIVGTGTSLVEGSIFYDDLGAGAGIYIGGGFAVIQNLAPGRIEGGAYGIYTGALNGTAAGYSSIDNAGTITGNTGIGVDGVGMSIVNSGTIEGTGGVAIAFAQSDSFNWNSLQLKTGSVIKGDVIGSVGDSARNTLELTGTGSEDISKFKNFQILRLNRDSMDPDYTPANWTLTGSSTFSESASINGGTMVVDGALTTPNLTVYDGTLTGSGMIVGDVSLGYAARLAGRQGQVLTIDGNLAMSDYANVDVALGAPSSNGLFDVKGDLTIGGKLNVSDLGGFGAGVYRIFDYGGSLTDNGFNLGTLPGGINSADLSIQTAIDKQVNLISAAGVKLNFWDGTITPVDGHMQGGDGVIAGGDGIWDASNVNWTDANGAINSQWNGEFAIFQGAAGTVTVDNSKGQVAAAGMQFATDGYVVEGDAIELTENESVVRVGVGSRAGADMTATIKSELTGSGGLVKTDYGTLILTANNTYTGDTAVKGGALVVGTATSMDAALSGSTQVNVSAGGALGGYGSVAGNVINDGVIAVGDAIGLIGGPKGEANFRILGDLDNGGTVIVAGSGIGNQLTVGGNYIGSGGTFVLNTVLNEGGSNAQTDKVVIAGDTSGTGKIAINNVGGTGGLTGTNPTDGIKIVEIGGESNAEFKLAHAVVAGIYDYGAYKADGQNWYLQSREGDPTDPGNPGGHVVDTVPGYNTALAGAQEHVLTTLDTFHERVGELRSEEMEDGFHAWTRGIGKTGSYSPKSITGYNGHGFDMTTGGVQVGGDYSLGGVFIPGDKLTVGVFGEYAHSNFDVRGRTASGSISSKGVGAYATWQQNAPTATKPGTGAYVDAVVKQDWLDLGVSAKSVSGFDIGHSYKGRATSASIETGYGFDLGNNVVLQPQAQLTWSKVTADNFTDSTGVAVRGQEAESLRGRLGIRLEKTFFFGDDQDEQVSLMPVPEKPTKGKAKAKANGKVKTKVVAAQPKKNKKFVKSVTTYVDANVKHEFKGRNGLIASDNAIGNDMRGTRYDVGVGAVAKLSKNVGLFGRASVEFGGSTNVAGTVSGGLKITW